MESATLKYWSFLVFSIFFHEKILHICEVAKDEQMVFVWDGTDTPPVSIQTKWVIISLFFIIGFI